MRSVDFYASTFGIQSPEAYERLLADAIIGDLTSRPRGVGEMDRCQKRAVLAGKELL